MELTDTAFEMLQGIVSNGMIIAYELYYPGELGQHALFMTPDNTIGLSGFYDDEGNETEINLIQLPDRTWYDRLCVWYMCIDWLEFLEVN